MADKGKEGRKREYDFLDWSKDNSDTVIISGILWIVGFAVVCSMLEHYMMGL